MRYCVQPATAKDVAMLALSMEDGDAGETEYDRNGDQKPLDHLLNAFLSSTEVWAAHNRDGQPCALWGVGPTSQDFEVGRFWLLTCEEVEAAPHDLAALSIIVLPEMLATYTRLESIVDAHNLRAVSLLRGLGFTVEPAAFHPASDRPCHRVWIEADASILAKTRPLLLN
ncbi:hypothetical protein [Reyranella sp.]|uniref:hypothetical protein n=1 Tax=Reyranella sp. TaxID=1929291 RepID=UPI003D11A99B